MANYNNDLVAHDQSAEGSVEMQQKTAASQEIGTGSLHDSSDHGDTEKALPAKEAQTGVQKIEAITLTWGKGSLGAALCL